MQQICQATQVCQTHAKNPKQEEERRRYLKRKGQGGQIINFVVSHCLIYRARVFTSLLPLVIPPNTSFNAYTINTNGLNPTRCAPLSPGTNLVKLNKLKMLRDLANRKNLDAIHLTETHDQNPGPSKGMALYAFRPNRRQTWHSHAYCNSTRGCQDR
jgi:hypothetical protein